MAAAMTFYSTAILLRNSMLQILHLWHRDFLMRFSKKILRANGGVDLFTKHKL